MVTDPKVTSALALLTEMAKNLDERISALTIVCEQLAQRIDDVSQRVWDLEERGHE